MTASSVKQVHTTTSSNAGAGGVSHNPIRIGAAPIATTSSTATGAAVRAGTRRTTWARTHRKAPVSTSSHWAAVLFPGPG